MSKSVELFSGCGGLALGLSRAGFKHEALIEFNDSAVATMKYNRERGIAHVQHWPVIHEYVRNIDWRRFRGLDLVAGGPPCQPFSIGGKAAGAADKRDMWPTVFRAVAEVEPKAFIFENVRGLARPRFKDYLQSIVSNLAKPARGLSYGIRVQLLNAADYGAAQKRNRVLILGLRGGGDRELQFPLPSHSRDRLVWDQWITGEYWEQHELEQDLDGFPKSDASIVRRLRKTMIEPREKRWVTVRDRLFGLGDPDEKNNHRFQGGAKVYPGHTGSPLDQPAKALKAGDHGVPGGENMMVKDNNEVRYFTIRECARLQGLPDDFQFSSSWTESMRQLGNAVPVEVAEMVGSWMNNLISQKSKDFAIAA